MNHFRVGYAIANGWGPSWMNNHHFEGDMTAIRVWNVERTPEQIQQSMDVPTEGLADTSGLILYGPVDNNLVRVP